MREAHTREYALEGKLGLVSGVKKAAKEAAEPSQVDTRVLGGQKRKPSWIF